MIISKLIAVSVLALTVKGNNARNEAEVRVKVRIHPDSSADFSGLHDAEIGAMDALHDLSSELDGEEERSCRASFHLKLKRGFDNVVYRFDDEESAIGEDVSFLAEIKSATVKAVHGKLHVEVDLSASLDSASLVKMARKVGREDGSTLTTTAAQLSLFQVEANEPAASAAAN